MKLVDFHIGGEFVSEGRRWRCTDIGSRVIVAIRVDGTDVVTMQRDGEPLQRHIGRAEADRAGWFNGPPYAVAEHVFDENDLEGCEPI